MAAANSLETKATAWLASNLTQDDVKLFTPLFTSQGVSSVADLLNLTKERLVELKVAIGPRNRYAPSRALARSLPPSPFTRSTHVIRCVKPTRSHRDLISIHRRQSHRRRRPRYVAFSSLSLPRTDF
jgi:hypothetical protein